MAAFTQDAPRDLVAQPFNVLRFSLHPRGLAARIVNLRQWRTHLLDRLERQVHARGGDARLASLYGELLAYPATNELTDRPGADDGEVDHHPDVFIPLRVRLDEEELTFFSTVTVFGTPRDVTVEELQIEHFYPADPVTEKYLRSRASCR